MVFNTTIHHRQSIRLRGHDYTKAGLYFVTICTHNRLPLFGEVIEGKMFPNEAGILVQQCWEAIPEHFPSVILDEFVVMPNHVHGIIVMGDANVGAKDFLPLQPNGGGNVGANNHLPPQVKPGTARTLGSVVRGFKIGVTKWFRTHTEVHSVWQRNYYEHIIRNETAYVKIADYIQTNPQRWEADTYHV
ncbi:MAG: transposase [Thiolinea sp.]